MARIQTSRVFADVDGAFRAGFRTISLQGSSRSGKTYNVMIWLIQLALRTPDTGISVVRATLPSVKRTVYRDFEDIMHRLGLFDRRRFNKTELIYRFGNGSWIEFFSVENEQKVRGAKRSILFVNEANELLEASWVQLMLRTTRLAIIDYNPSFSEEHWISASINRDETTAFFKTTYRDNPFLERHVIENIESLRGKNENLWRIYGLGEQAVVEGLIFPGVELIPQFPARCERQYVGVDFGYANDPTAIIRVGIEGESLYLEELAYATHMLTADIIRELKRVADLPVISESADPRLVDEIRRAGIRIRAVRKYRGSIEAGIQTMQGMALRAAQGSVNLIKELRSYTYERDREGNFTNSPIDAYNHALDAVRYVVMETVMGGPPRRPNLERLLGKIH